MTTELTPYSERPSLISTRAERDHARAMNSVVRATQMQGRRVDAEAALTGRIMERTVDLDNYRRSLAGGDPVLDSVLTRIEISFVDKALRHQRDFGSMWSS